MDFSIEPISAHTIDATITLVQSVFPGSAERIALSIRAGFEPDTHRDFIATHYAKERWTWVALADGAVVGTVGLYDEHDDSDTVWLGWYVVAPTCRGAGLGRQLLNFATEQARLMGKRTFRIYTGDDPKMARAQQVYERAGFAVYRTEPSTDDPGETIVYREKVLTPQT